MRGNGLLDRFCLVLAEDSGLELGRGLVVEGGVFAVEVVVGFDVGEEFGAGVPGIDEAAAVEHFGLQRPHEGFGPGVVVRVGTGGHALADAALAQDFTEGGAAVLAATVAVEDWLLSGAARTDRLSECIDGKLRAQVIGQ